MKTDETKIIIGVLSVLPTFLILNFHTYRLIYEIFGSLHSRCPRVFQFMTTSVNLPSDLFYLLQPRRLGLCSCSEFDKLNPTALLLTAVTRGYFLLINFTSYKLVVT